MPIKTWSAHERASPPHLIHILYKPGKDEKEEGHSGPWSRAVSHSH